MWIASTYSLLDRENESCSREFSQADEHLAHPISFGDLLSAHSTVCKCRLPRHSQARKSCKVIRMLSILSVYLGILTIIVFKAKELWAI